MNRGPRPCLLRRRAGIRPNAFDCMAGTVPPSGGSLAAITALRLKEFEEVTQCDQVAFGVRISSLPQLLNGMELATQQLLSSINS